MGGDRKFMSSRETSLDSTDLHRDKSFTPEVSLTNGYSKDYDTKSADSSVDRLHPQREMGGSLDRNGIGQHSMDSKDRHRTRKKEKGEPPRFSSQDRISTQERARERSLSSDRFSLPFFDKEEKIEAASSGGMMMAPGKDTVPLEKGGIYGSYSGASFASSFDPDNIAMDRHPIYSGFLVSFMVDARGGAMRGCRHSGVRIIVPAGKACMPTRVTCKLVKKDKLMYSPPLMEGEALASRILEMGPVAAKFSGPVLIEVPHFASLRGREREIVILRSEDGKNWKEHNLEATEDAVQEALNGSFEGEDLESAEELYNKRITRILTTDFPQYFAVVSRIRQETKVLGPESGILSSTVVPQVQVVFPERSLTKKIKVGLQIFDFITAQPIPPELVSKMLGNRVAVS